MSGMSEDGTDQSFDKGSGGTGTDAVSGLALLSLLVNLDSGVDVLAAVSASSAVRYSGWIIVAVARDTSPSPSSSPPTRMRVG